MCSRTTHPIKTRLLTSTVVGPLPEGDAATRMRVRSRERRAGGGQDDDAIVRAMVASAPDEITQWAEGKREGQ